MRTLVVLVTHIYNDFVVDRYNDLKRSLIDNFELVLAHSNECTEENYFEKNNINHIKLPLREDQLDARNEKCPNNGKFFVDVYNYFPNFDYYWFIEYDVMVNTTSDAPFKNIFEYFDNRSSVKDADLIADHINTYSTSHHYNYRYPWNDLESYYVSIPKLGLTKKDIYFGFYTICRLSNKLLNDFGNDEDYLNLFFEWGITTYAYKHDMKICTLQNLFTTSAPMDKGDQQRDNINRGSNSWKAKEFKSKYTEYPDGYIVHPVKNYD